MRLFPFESARRGQDELIRDVAECVANGRNLLACAPSGIGKTAATLSPSLEYALENDKTVVFLTPRHSQHMVVVETLRRIGERYGVKIPSVDIIGKRWLCPVKGIEELSTQEFNDYCSTVKKDERCIFYNRTREGGELTHEAEALVKKILNSHPLHAEELKQLCKGFCPYEIFLEVAKQSRVITCDYYHIFSPIRRIFLKRINRELDDLIIIVDEAHNLPERIRKILSSQISTTSLAYALKEARLFGFDEVARRVSEIRSVLKSLAKRKLAEKHESYVAKHEFVEQLSDIDSTVVEFEDAAICVRERRKRSYIGNVGSFLSKWCESDEGYARIIAKRVVRGKESVVLKRVCLDPSLISGDVLSDAHSAILISATLTPLKMYYEVLGLDSIEKETLCKKYTSPFPRTNRLNLIVPTVTTKFTNRTLENYERIAENIINICKAVPGNVAAYFPSYEMCGTLANVIREKLSALNVHRRILVEKPEMNKEQKSEMYRTVLESSDVLLLGCQSGSFSEGVDFISNSLRCVIVVGLSLAQPDLETKALIEYYDRKFSRGWSYAYIYPAVHRALQTAGRCIRSERDRGVIVFMDFRFLWKNYRTAFPVDFDFSVSENPEREIERFFRRTI